MTGDRAIRWGTAAAVLAVAAFAAVISYSHIYDLGRALGQAGTAARLLPLSVDGLILAAGLVLLHAARNGHQAPGLGRCMLWLGIAATVGANVAYGARYGLLGAVISAWPAVAFIGSAEMALGMIRSARTALAPAGDASAPDAPAPAPAADAPPAPAPRAAPVPAGLNGHGHQAAELFAAELAAGRIPGLRAIQSRMSVGQARAQLVQRHLRDLAVG